MSHFCLLDMSYWPIDIDSILHTGLDIIDLVSLKWYFGDN